MAAAPYQAYNTQLTQQHTRRPDKRSAIGQYNPEISLRHRTRRPDKRSAIGQYNPPSLSGIAPSGGAFVNVLLCFGAFVAQKLCIVRFYSPQALLFPPLLAKNKHL
ncbi:hypothetical protein ACX122_18835 [Kosakonia cowanii]